MTAPVLEHALIERLAGGFRGSPLQLNGRHESDAELLRLPGTDAVLALTTDTVIEEIASGLYRDPWLIGWMGVTVNASDLAAVGAEPVGILLSLTLPPDASDELLTGLRAGICAASERYSLPVIGGDTNHGVTLAVGGTAVGLVSDGRPLTRLGAHPGDRLFASGPLGLGGAFAFYRLVGRGGGEGFDSLRPVGRGSGEAIVYRPVARLREGALLRRFASCCMDTSDGLIPTLDELARRNGCGFTLDPTERVLHPDAFGVISRAGLPPWLPLAGPHGEFELVFAVPPSRVDAMRDAAGEIGWTPLELGIVTENAGVVRLTPDGDTIDTTRVRNLFEEVGGDVGEYLKELQR
jgi:thiamine-monophosphate kinase